MDGVSRLKCLCQSTTFGLVLLPTTHRGECALPVFLAFLSSPMDSNRPRRTNRRAPPRTPETAAETDARRNARTKVDESNPALPTNSADQGGPAHPSSTTDTVSVPPNDSDGAPPTNTTPPAAQTAASMAAPASVAPIGSDGAKGSPPADASPSTTQIAAAPLPQCNASSVEVPPAPRSMPVIQADNASTRTLGCTDGNRFESRAEISSYGDARDREAVPKVWSQLPDWARRDMGVQVCSEPVALAAPTANASNRDRERSPRVLESPTDLNLSSSEIPLRAGYCVIAVFEDGGPVYSAGIALDGPPPTSFLQLFLLLAGSNSPSKNTLLKIMELAGQNGQDTWQPLYIATAQNIPTYSSRYDSITRLERFQWIMPFAEALISTSSAVSTLRKLPDTSSVWEGVRNYYGMGPIRDLSCVLILVRTSMLLQGA